MAFVGQGCVLASHCLLGPTFSQVAPAQTRVLAGEPPTGSYDIIATVMVDVAGGADTTLTQLRRNATSLGADAIIHTRLALLNTGGMRIRHRPRCPHASRRAPLSARARRAARDGARDVSTSDHAAAGGASTA